MITEPSSNCSIENIHDKKMRIHAYIIYEIHLLVSQVVAISIGDKRHLKEFDISEKIHVFHVSG